MSEATPNSGPQGGPQGGEPPSLVVLAQYLKDLSFENPKAPASFTDPSRSQPQIDVDVNVNARGIGQDRYEVELTVSARAKQGKDIAFVVETAYAGAFEIKNMTPEQLELIMLVECPRILFPFVRQIVADATRNGNFPPLMLEPIDFFTIYEQNRQRALAQKAAEQQPAHA
ncbi:MAG: protein-export chaperone SecB [Pseudomonadota bacterium]|nr:protein-export chaperone SecB [Pseudomonadota bacterium]